MEFKEKLIKLRKEKGMTQEELSNKLFVSRQAITKWELGNGMPDIDNLKALANLFNVDINYLLSNEENLAISKESTLEVNSSNRKKVISSIIMALCLLGDIFALIGLLVLPLIKIDLGILEKNIGFFDAMGEKYLNSTESLLIGFGVLLMMIPAVLAVVFQQKFIKKDYSKPKKILLLGIGAFTIFIIGLAFFIFAIPEGYGSGSGQYLFICGAALELCACVIFCVFIYLLGKGILTEEKLFKA